MSHDHNAYLRGPSQPVGRVLLAIECSVRPFGYTPVGMVQRHRMRDANDSSGEHLPGFRGFAAVAAEVDGWRGASAQLTGELPTLDLVLSRTDRSLYLLAVMSALRLHQLVRSAGAEQFRRLISCLASAVEATAGCGGFELFADEAANPDLVALLRGEPGTSSPCSWGIIHRSRLDEETERALLAADLVGVESGDYRFFEHREGIV